MKTTSNGRRPQNVKSWISQQPLIGSSWNFKLKPRGPNQNEKCLQWRWPLMEGDVQWKMTSNGRQPPMEDDLKILNVEYLRNHWLDLSQNLSLSSGDQTKIKNAWNEDDLQWKMTSKYQKLNISDLPQILNLISGDQFWIKNDWNDDDLKILKLNISATTDRIFLKF